MGRGGGARSGGGGRGGSVRSGSSRSTGHSSGSRASFSSGRSRGHGSSSSSGGSRSASTGSRGGSSYRAAGPARRGFGFGGPRYYGGGGYGYGYGSPYGARSGCGCLSGTVMLVFALALVLAVVPAACMHALSGSSSHSGNSSTSAGIEAAQSTTSWHERDRLDEADCMESLEWIDDQADWLDNEETVVEGMRSFYELTGVQPYLIIADQIDGSKDYTEQDVESYLRERYDELFEDDGHMILLFLEPYANEYDPYLLVGQKAHAVVDADGEDIIYQAIDRWYTDGDLTDEQYFARIFKASGHALMDGTRLSEFD